MSFGRQRNMMRRPSRPDESFHRSSRRRNVDRLAMLEQRTGGTPRRGLASRLVAMVRSILGRK